MFELRIDMADFERQAKALGGRIDQLPFALSRAMNSAVKDARTLLITHTWPSHVQVRNKGFLNAALRMEFATKGRLQVAITDAGLPGRAHLGLHADGGQKSAKGSFAIPSANVKVGASGVVAKQRARALPNSFRKGDAIYQRVPGRGKKGETGLKYMFTLKSSVRQPADVPFRDDFAEAMLNGVRSSFPEAFRRAVSTAR